MDENNQNKLYDDHVVLTVAIPCYNSQDYLDKAVRSALIDVPGIEVIIVDDGSTDSTPQIADNYVERYPEIVRVIHKENGGHGDAVMAGLAAARGKYFKVLDSDDWLNRKALMAVMDFLTYNIHIGEKFDILFSDYVYEHDGNNKKHCVSYKHVMPVRTSFKWDEIGRFKPWENILMHSVIYRTKLLRQSGITLPKHTFYVDNIYVYHPLPYAKRLYYLDVDLYHYRTGRIDQSVNEKNMMDRIDQQIRVTKLMIEDYPLRNIENKRLRSYMSSYLSMMMMVPTAFLIKKGTKEALHDKDELWQFLKKEYPGQYKYVCRHFLGCAGQLHSRLGRNIIKLGYEISQKMFGFN